MHGEILKFIETYLMIYKKNHQ